MIDGFMKAEVAGQIVTEQLTLEPAGKSQKCDFTVTWNDPKKEDGFRENYKSIDVTVWGKTAEWVVKTLGNGSVVMVEGIVETKSFETRDNRTFRKTEFRAVRVHSLDNGVPDTSRNIYQHRPPQQRPQNGPPDTRPRQPPTPRDEAEAYGGQDYPYYG